MNSYIHLSEFLELSAERLDKEIIVSSDVAILGFSPLNETRDETISWSASDNIDWSNVRASVMICPVGTQAPKSSKIVLIRTESPRKLFAEWLSFFVKTTSRPQVGVEKSAFVHPAAKIHETAYIGHFAVIEDGVVVGANSTIGHHSVLRSNTIIGSYVSIKSHCVIGEDGFGFVKDVDDISIRIPHIGWVEISDHADVGSFTTVCRGTLGATRIMNNAKVDDHVHIAHNVTIKERAMVVACAEVSGSTVVGEDAWLAPGCLLRDAIIIGRDVVVGMGAVVTKDVPDGAVIVGNPGRVRAVMSGQKT